jgi:hypothetical protein
MPHFDTGLAGAALSFGVVDVGMTAGEIQGHTVEIKSGKHKKADYLRKYLALTHIETSYGSFWNVERPGGRLASFNLLCTELEVQIQIFLYSRSKTAFA